MQIVDMLLTNKNARPGTKIIPRGLVIHWTANEGKGANAVANRNYFNKPTTEASAHYIVDDKQIVRCLPENEMAYHVGAKQYKPEAVAKLSSYPNNCTIGIEMCVNADGNFQETYRRTVELAADILKRYGWGVDRLWRHFDITGKCCPAYFVDDKKARQYLGTDAATAWREFKEDVQNVLTGKRPPKAPVVQAASISSQKSAGNSVNNSVDNSCGIEVNGKVLTVRGILRDGKSLLPVRAVSEAAGRSADVGWCEATKKVLLAGKPLESSLVIDGTGYAWSMEIAAALDLTVEWDGQTKTVKLKKGCA